MNLKGLDLFHLSKLTSHQVDHVTCLECCKYYIAPETAVCGHTLCHACWRGRRTCPSCAAPLERRSLKLNLQLQNLTEHIHTLGEAFEKLFNIKLDEFVLDETNNDLELKNEVESDPTKNVKDWLASSQNQFSAPVINSEPFSQEINNRVELSTSKIQVHMNSKKSKSPQKVIYVAPPQDDWDKIEQLPDTDEGCINNKENLTHQTNKQPLLSGDEYTTANPRRSSRKRENNSQNESLFINQDIITEKQSSKNSSSETEKKSNKAKQNWNNVKRMRKEFSKLNKKNRSKLNVSIEMCKKTQSTTYKQKIEAAQQKPINKDSQPIAYTIEDNTPDINANNNIDQIISDAVPNEIISSNNNNEKKHILESPNITAKISDETNQDIDENMCPKPDQIENNNLQRSTLVKDRKMSQNNAKKIDESTNTNVPFVEITETCPNCSGRNQGTDVNSNSKSSGKNLDDIEITFKVGNTLTNITIKRKNNDVQLKVKTDREVQTSLGSNCLVSKNNEFNIEQGSPQEIEINIDKNNSMTATKIENKPLKNITELPILNKSSSTKKNTASADTATAQFEITESVEKELSNVMECVEVVENNDTSKIKSTNNNDIENCEDFINDLDIFDNESVKEQHVQLLNKSKQAPSEILMPTVKTKSQKHRDKRDRDRNEDEEANEPYAKKIKTASGNSDIAENNFNNSTLQQSNKENESINYDLVMGRVFANIDADIEKSQKSAKNNPPNNKNNETVQESESIENILQIQNSKQGFTMSAQKVTKGSECVNEKYSENIFSIVEKDEETDDLAKKSKYNDAGGSTQQHIDNLLTPGMCQDLISTHEENIEINKEHCTPFHENDDSDKSVVEETPQKNVSFPKPKNVSDVSIVTNQLQRVNSGIPKLAPSSQLIKSVINVSDTLVDTTSKDHADLGTTAKKQTLETPLTINKFVDHIKHKSTPVARKSLNFDSENIDDVDPEQTLCPSSMVAKTTQEKEFMTKAFEQTPKSPVKKPLMTRNFKEVDLRYCIAGSCLSTVELTNVKFLCRKYNWKYVDKYTRELTHLVVGVDEDNRSQRSVKYMCALAASKWIVSYDWVDACINTNLVVGESLYEALDGTGEPGPKRSRLAKTKLFQGITFYCMPPFSVLDVGALKEMLEAAGGRVVNEVKAVKAVSDAPALLLAEPEHTQEDRFMYLALELNIVPVNYEWVLNCLGSYTLSSFQELLMCPAALLPPATAQWPDVLMARDTE